MKTTTKVITVILLTAMISTFTSCEKNPFKKDLDEIMKDKKWKTTEWIETHDVSGDIRSFSWYEEYFTSECEKNSYLEYGDDGIVYSHRLCYDTLITNQHWKTEDDRNIIYEWVKYTYSHDGNNEIIGEKDTIAVWEVEEYSRKEIKIKIEYQEMGYNSLHNVTQTKTLSSFK